MYHYGIIGYPLEHSFSARYFTEKFSREGIDAEYRLFPLSNVSVVHEMLYCLDGFNVTFPYKQSVMSYLSDIDSIAQTIGAVNVVCGNKGYNTDWIGFVESLRPLLQSTDNQALILGTGGVSKAVQYGLHQLGIHYTLVSREPQNESVISYFDITSDILERHTIIINCTPLGMYPNVHSLPDIPYQQLSSRHLLYDCVYNPARTAFLLRGEEYGARIKNGLQMLEIQADAAWEIWKEQIKTK